MNRPLTPVLFLTFFAARVNLHVADASKGVCNDPANFSGPGLSHHRFASAAMSQEVGGGVALPPGYDGANDRLPVLYDELTSGEPIAFLTRDFTRSTKTN
jgi:hypothetical protein